MRAVQTGVLLLSLAIAAPAAAFPARDTARVAPKGTWSVGIFNPLRWVAAERLEVSTHPLVALGSPNVLARYDFDVADTWTVALEGGLSLPWATFSASPPLGLKGYFAPSCLVSEAEPERGDTCRRPGLHLVPRFGVVGSLGTDDVLTLRADSAIGLPLASDEFSPIDAWPHLDLLLAPVSTGHRTRVHVRYDHALTDWLRADAEVAGYLVGAGPDPQRSPLVWYAHIGFDLRTSEGTRLTAGAAYWNSDQRRRELRRTTGVYSEWVDVRNHDFAPTLDFIWTW